MPPFDSLPLAAAAAACAVVLCLVLALLAWRLRQRRADAAPARGRPKARSDRAGSRDGSELVARYQPSAVRVLTACEREAFDLVREVLPEHLVMAQVPLVRYLRVHDKRTEDDWLRGLSMLSADILVCDTSSRPVIAVEILPPKLGPKAQERHERMRQLLEGVGVRVLIWQEARLPPAEQVRTQLRAALDSEAAASSRQRSAVGGAAPAARRRGAGVDPRSSADAMRIEPELGQIDPPPRGAGSTRSSAPPAGAAATAPVRAAAAATGGAAAATASAATASAAAARPAAASGFAPLIPVPEIAELLAEGDEIAARHSSFDPVSLTFFDEFEARQQGNSSGVH
jgi:hypothetical protein